MARGKVAVGAIDAAEGTVNLGLSSGAYAATKAGLLAGEAGVAAGALTMVAGAAAGASISLAAETARAAASGEKTPIEVADQYYGTHFGDVYQWQKESPPARMALGIASAGLSEVWFNLNESLDD